MKIILGCPKCEKIKTEKNGCDQKCKDCGEDRKLLAVKRELTMDKRVYA